ncbi:hypothetical protein [Erythrobacter sp.]|jgi:hypothetical protein|uniref:hypothetical protein n=1 Tax=Erythrobacter sp. TaxID=1042 RepID=UPI002EC04B03|nr:hypothetical protein [Erythrobacter sp.]
MILRPLFAAAAAAILLSPPAFAQDAGVEHADGATPVRLVAFDGEQEFLKTSKRLRIWRAAVGYTLSVDEAGKVTGCKLVNEFRKNYVNQMLCEVLVEHHTFEPAHDASGAAVPGTYTARLVYEDLRAKT